MDLKPLLSDWDHPNSADTTPARTFKDRKESGRVEQA